MPWVQDKGAKVSLLEGLWTGSVLCIDESFLLVAGWRGKTAQSSVGEHNRLIPAGCILEPVNLILNASVGPQNRQLRTHVSRFRRVSNINSC